MSELSHLSRKESESFFPPVPFLHWLSSVLETASRQHPWPAVHTSQAHHRNPAVTCHKCPHKGVINTQAEGECWGDTGRAMTANGRCAAQFSFKTGELLPSRMVSWRTPGLSGFRTPSGFEVRQRSSCGNSTSWRSLEVVQGPVPSSQTRTNLVGNLCATGPVVEAFLGSF